MGSSKTIVLGFPRFCKFCLFKYLKKGISKIFVLGFLRFSKYAFFKYLKKWYEQSNCARLFKTL